MLSPLGATRLEPIQTPSASSDDLRKLLLIQNRARATQSQDFLCDMRTLCAIRG